MYQPHQEEAGIYDDQFNNPFSEKTIRQAFIRKVYSILSVQLLVSFGFVVAFTSLDAAKALATNNPWLMFVAFILMFGTMIPMICSQDLRRKVPHNFIFLGLFTLAEAFMLGVITSMIDKYIVLKAVLMTALVVGGLTIFAFQTKIDFTKYNGIMFCILLCFTLFGFFSIFFQRGGFMSNLYAGLGVLIFSIYLVIDTQHLAGGTHKFQLQPEEYIFGALVLYLDIINLFLYILELLSNNK